MTLSTMYVRIDAIYVVHETHRLRLETEPDKEPRTVRKPLSLTSSYREFVCEYVYFN